MPHATHATSPLSPERRRLGLALALGATAALSACIVVPAGRYPSQGGYPPPQQPYGPSGPPGGEGEVITQAPPAPQVDVIIAAPGPGFFWIGGYWGWLGGRHVWMGGRWEAYRPGWRWAPYAWHPHGHGWRAAPGRWERH